MKSYEDYKTLVDELLANEAILDSDVFYYEDSPLKDICANFFSEFQTILTKIAESYNIQPAAVVFNNTIITGAKALKKNSYYIISINIGTVHRLYNFFHENFLEENMDLDVNSNEELADELFYTSVLFIFLHELAHLIQLSKLPQFEHTENFGVSANKDSHTQLREFDADIFATESIIKLAIHEWLKNKDSEKLFEKAVNILSSLSIIFLLDQGGVAPLYFTEKTHPHHLIRMAYVQNQIFLLLEPHIKPNLALIMNRLLKIMQRLEKEFKMNIAKEYENIVLHSHKDKIREYVTKLWYETNKLPESLLYYKRLRQAQ